MYQQIVMENCFFNYHSNSSWYIILYSVHKQFSRLKNFNSIVWGLCFSTFTKTLCMSGGLQGAVLGMNYVICV